MRRNGSTCYCAATVLFIGIFAGVFVWRPDLMTGVTWFFRIHAIRRPVIPKLPALVIYHTCKVRKHAFSPSRSPFPTRAAPCTEDQRHDCYEGTPFLDFLIETYDAPLAETYVFMHAHDHSWHVQGSVWSTLNSLAKTRYFKEADYGGLFPRYWNCGPWPPGGHDPWYPDIYNDIFAGTTMPKVEYTFNNTHPCCSTVFFKSYLVQTRPKSDYILMRNQSREWSKAHDKMPKGPGYFCGRVLEYNWHLILTNRTMILRERDWDRAHRT